MQAYIGYFAKSGSSSHLVKALSDSKSTVMKFTKPLHSSGQK